MLKNQIKTFLLIAVLTALLLGLGQLIGGRSGLIIGLSLALVINFGTYWHGDKLVLRMYKAKPASQVSYPNLHKDIEEICRTARIPKPKIYVVPLPIANAFACGRGGKHSVVAVTEGILKKLDRKELKGVLSHEISHIKNKDILISTIAATIAGVITYIAFMARFAAIFGGMGDNREGSNIIGLLVMAIVAPIIALLIQLAISRSREFIADESGAKLLKDPLLLANALLKLEKSAKERPIRGVEATSHLFIVNPFSARGMAKLFSTHPPVDERVKRLRAINFK